MAWRRVIVCEETIENLPPPCGETLQSGYSKERGGWGKYKVINCGWAWNRDSSQYCR